MSSNCPLQASTQQEALQQAQHGILKVEQRAHLGAAIRLRHAAPELTPEEQELMQQLHTGLERRFSALGVNLVGCIAHARAGNWEAAQ